MEQVKSRRRQPSWRVREENETGEGETVQGRHH